MPGGGGGQIDNELPTEPPPGGETVPEDVYTPRHPRGDCVRSTSVSVYNPKTHEWITKSYSPR